jgi:hypothetical protein
VRRIDRWLGLALALLAGAVLWSARAFPVVPGQKVGAGFLPTLVGAGLLLCGLALVVRSLRALPGHAGGARREHFGSSLVSSALSSSRPRRGWVFSSLRRCA